MFLCRVASRRAEPLKPDRGVILDADPHAVLETDGSFGHPSIIWSPSIEDARALEKDRRPRQEARGSIEEWSAIWPGSAIERPAAILLVIGIIQDWSRYRFYLAGLRESGLLARFGATPIFHGAPMEVLHGDYGAERVTVAIRLPSAAATELFWNSEDYASIRKRREGAARLNVGVWMCS